MNKIFRLPAMLFILAAVIFASCKKADSDLNLTPGTFAANTLTASSANVVLAAATENDTAVRFNWSAAAFGPDPVVSYTLQLDTPGDTTAANHWTNAKNYPLGAGVYRYGFVTKDLNNLLNGMGLNPGSASVIAFRVKAEVNQQNGSASTVPGVYTKTAVVTVTTYGLDLYVPGDYQGWNPGAAPVLKPIIGMPGKYEGYVNITGTGTQYFKFTNAPDWNHTNYGDGGSGTFSTDGAAAGLSVPGPGYYELTADLNANKWTATKTTWAIIGDASPGGWSNDTQMAYDAASQTWKLTCNMVQAGSFKFRANNQWSIDFGIDGTGKLLYADNPFFPYNGSLNNLSVPQDGNYTITLDLHNSGNYTYILHRN